MFLQAPHALRQAVESQTVGDLYRSATISNPHQLDNVVKLFSVCYLTIKQFQ